MFGQDVLMEAKHFPALSLATVAHHGIPDTPRSNNPHTPYRHITINPFRNVECKNKGRTLKSPPEFAHNIKFSGTTQVLPGRESKAHSARVKNYLCRRCLPLRRRAAIT
jgi:hypothetical protein